MREHVFRFIGAIFLTILALLGIGAALHILVTLPFEGKGPEWVSAIGTVATLIWTVRIATTETRRRERSELVLAGLHASSMLNRLIHANAAIEAIRNILKKTAQGGGDVLFAADCRDILNTINAWKIDELVPLAPLPGNIAINLARAADQLSAVRIVFENEIEKGSIYSNTSRKEIASTFYGNLSETQDFVSQAVSVCKAIIRQPQDS